MFYKFMADIVRIIHVLVIVLLVMGIWISDKYPPTYRLMNLIFILTTGLSQILFRGCPLTILENALRKKYDPTTTYPGSFISFHLHNRLGINDLFVFFKGKSKEI